MRRWLGVLGALLLLGCPSQPTTVLLTIEAEATVGSLDALELDVFSPTGVAVQGRRLPEEGPPELPDDVVLYPPVSSGPLRMVVDGIRGGALVAQGAATVELKPGEQVKATVTLAAGQLPDGDGDGVPDVVDSCPAAPNPDQGPCPGADGPLFPDAGDSAVTDGPSSDRVAVPDQLRPDFPQLSCTVNSECDDQDACTTEQCVSGECVYAVVACPSPPNTPCKVAACDKDNGCYVADAPDNTTCDDGLFCTEGDACKTGSCVSQPRDCSVGAPSCKVGTCNETLNTCTYSSVPTGATCDDSDPCTQGETCDSNGACTAPDPVTETVTSAQIADGSDRTIVVDSQGNVHIVYFFVPATELRYATNASGSWVISTIDSNGDTGHWPALAIDSQDSLHVVYEDSTNSTMRYAVRSGNNWVKYAIGPGVGHSGIAVSGAKIHVSYVNNNALYYASGAGGSWSPTQIEAAGGAAPSAGVFSSLALDSGGKVHIAHAWGSLGTTLAAVKLRHSTDASGSWVSEDAAPGVTGSHGALCSIAIDSQDTIRISHYTHVSAGPIDGLHLSTRVQGGSWQTQTLVTGAQGSFSSILVNGKDDVYIAYRKYDVGELRYITNASGSWQATVLDTNGQTGRWASIFQAPSGRIHIGYEEDAAGLLRHAYFSACP